MLRVKNESRWIDRVVKSMQPVCGRILVLDDHSGDGTPEICESLGCTVYRSGFDTLHEARDKDWLLAKVWESGAQVGDWCLMLDGDEILHPADCGQVFAATCRPQNAWSFRVVYLWDREDRARADGLYSRFWRPSFFRLTHRGLTFKRTDFGGNLHCSSAPAELLGGAKQSAVRLLHLGYLHKEDRVRKYHWYNSIDPDNALEDGYRHMVIGDVFPADSAFKHAGPLRLVPLEKF